MAKTAFYKKCMQFMQPTLNVDSTTKNKKALKVGQVLFGMIQNQRKKCQEPDVFFTVNP